MVLTVPSFIHLYKVDDDTPVTRAAALGRRQTGFSFSCFILNTGRCPVFDMMTQNVRSSAIRQMFYGGGARVQISSPFSVTRLRFPRSTIRLKHRSTVRFAKEYGGEVREVLESTP